MFWRNIVNFTSIFGGYIQTCHPNTYIIRIKRMILIVEQICNTILALRLFCNWIKTVSNWDQWPKLEKSASHSEKKSTVNKSAQCEQTDIYLLYEINRCEHCYVTACIFIYTSFQITAKMLNANLMNRQQTSIMLQTKWNYVCMSYHAHSLYSKYTQKRETIA